MLSFEPTPEGLAHADELPAVDDHLLAPGRYEAFDGVLVHVPPALPPHATAHARLAVLLGAHVGPSFTVALDMLTRTSETSEVAPDASIFPTARDPATGGRQIEQLAFEVVATQTMSYAGRKAAKLADRGVRRVFAIDIERTRVLEWSRELADWRELAADGVIADPVLAAPVPIAPLLDADLALDDAIAYAILAKREAAHAAARAEGKIEGKIEAVLQLLAAHGQLVAEADRAQLEAERDPARVDRWIRMAARGATIAALLASR